MSCRSPSHMSTQGGASSIWSSLMPEHAESPEHDSSSGRQRASHSGPRRPGTTGPGVVSRGDHARHRARAASSVRGAPLAVDRLAEGGGRPNRVAETQTSHSIRRRCATIPHPTKQRHRSAGGWLAHETLFRQFRLAAHTLQHGSAGSVGHMACSAAPTVPLQRSSSLTWRNVDNTEGRSQMLTSRPTRCSVGCRGGAIGRSSKEVRGCAVDR